MGRGSPCLATFNWLRHLGKVGSVLYASVPQLGNKSGSNTLQIHGVLTTSHAMSCAGHHKPQMEIPLFCWTCLLLLQARCPFGPLGTMCPWPQQRGQGQGFDPWTAHFQEWADSLALETGPVGGGLGAERPFGASYEMIKPRTV